MTKEEARDYIREWCPYDRQEEIIKALGQEPCEDAISRQAVKDMLMREWTRYIPMDLDVNLSFVLAKVDELPPVTLQPKIGR